MKKIVFVIEQLYGGGAERATAALMNEMCKDAEIHLISTYDHDASKDYPTDARIVKHTFGEPKRSKLETCMKRIAFIRRTVSEINPQCVVSLAACGTDVLLTAAMLGKKIPLVLSERNDPRRSPESKLLRLLRPFTYALCEGLVFQTKEAQSYFPSFMTEKSTVICNPITGNLPPRFEGTRKAKIVNCCRLMPQKNLDLLMDAFSDISGEFPDVTLEIWGDGPEKKRLEDKIRQMNMGDRIFLPGYSSNIYAQMRECAMFVSSSDYEGISNSMLEAIALGVPTICTDCPAGGARETIRSGINGLLVPTKDRKAMADAMRKLLVDPELAERLSSNGCTLRDEISVAVIARKWMEYFAKIAR